MIVTKGYSFVVIMLDTLKQMYTIWLSQIWPR